MPPPVSRTSISISLSSSSPARRRLRKLSRVVGGRAIARSGRVRTVPTLRQTAPRICPLRRTLAQDNRIPGSLPCARRRGECARRGAADPEVRRSSLWSPTRELPIGRVTLRKARLYPIQADDPGQVVLTKFHITYIRHVVDAEAIKQSLEGSGLRCTPQRYAVMAFLMEHNRHPTAAEIFEAVNRVDPRCSKATTYNDLRDLVQAGLLREVAVEGRAARLMRKACGITTSSATAAAI